MKKNADNKKFGNLSTVFSTATLSTVASVCGIISFILQMFTFPSTLNGGNWIAVIFGIFILIVSITVIVFATKLKKSGEGGIEKGITLLHERQTDSSAIRSKIVRSFIILAVFTYFIWNAGALYLYFVNSSDYFKKAEHGNVYSQVYVADYYHETGNEDECVYWYTVASTSSSKYGNIACNNLAYLYWQKHKADGDLEIYLSRIYELLKKSALGGNKTGEENLYRFVYYYDFVYEQNEDDRRKTLDLLIGDSFIRDYANFRQEVWEDAGTITVKDKIMFSDDYTKYELKDISRTLDKDDDTKIITTRVYTVKESSLNPDRMVLEYDSDINKHVQ